VPRKQGQVKRSSSHTLKRAEVAFVYLKIQDNLND